MVGAGSNRTLRHRMLLLASKPLKTAASPVAVPLVQRLQQLTGVLFHCLRRQPEGVLWLRHCNRLTAHPQFRTHRVDHYLIVRLPGLVYISVQHYVGNLWNRHHYLFHLGRSPRPPAPAFPVIGPPTVAHFILPATIASKHLVVEFASLSSCQQTARLALFIERSPHTPLLQEAPLLCLKRLKFWGVAIII